MIKIDYDTLKFQTVSTLSRLLQTRKISSVELTQYFLDRLERLGQYYNATAEITRNLAIVQASRSDKLLRAKGSMRGHLLGVPYGIKDLFATKKIPTRWGSPAFQKQIFDYDATVIKKMYEAGAVLIGKLAMIELAGAGEYAHANASLHGPGLNPWNQKHWSGGSSSGSAIAVTAGLVPIALATETWGSIIIPSACCGITGLRPTWGRVSRYGAMELAWNMDKIGPMAHNVEDCGLVLQAIAGEDSKDESTTTRSLFKLKPRIKNRGFHLGILPIDFSDCSAEIEQAFEDALKVMRQNGIKFTQVVLPKCPYDELTSLLMGCEISAVHEKFIKSKKINKLIDPKQKRSLQSYLNISAAQYLQALRKKNAISDPILKILDGYDAFISPSRYGGAPRIDTNLLNNTSHKGLDYNFLGALFGLPALSIPMGFDKQKLPLGLMFTGKLYDENTLLQIGMIYQKETAWHLTHPNSVKHDFTKKPHLIKIG